MLHPVIVWSQASEGAEKGEAFTNDITAIHIRALAGEASFQWRFHRNLEDKICAKKVPWKLDF